MTIQTREMLVRRIAETSGKPAAVVDQIVRQLLDAICLAVASGEAVELHRFGAFRARQVPERIGRDPASGDSLVIPAHRKVTFTAYVALRQAVRDLTTGGE